LCQLFVMSIDNLDDKSQQAERPHVA
jgi:hypothetical protein